MQFPGQAPVVGVVYLTTMSRPDSALALAMLYTLQGKREARMGAISVSGAGVETAAFCDAVGRFYAGPGPLSNSNRVLPIGLAAEGPLPPDPPMVTAVMKRRDEKDAPLFVHTTFQVSDTSEPCALIRNAMTAQADGHTVIVASAPATHLARVLGLQGIRELIKAKVRAVVLCETENQDIAAARRILADWPSPVVFCGKSLGDALPFPGASVEKDFAWSPAHPVAEAYRAYRPMPYDAPAMDLAAMLYAIRPDSGLLQVSEPGTLKIADTGKPAFLTEKSPSESPRRELSINAARKDELLKSYIELVTAKPAAKSAGRRG